MYYYREKIAKILMNAYEYVDFEKVNEVPEFIRELRELYAYEDNCIREYEEFIEEEIQKEKVAELKEMIGQ